MVKLYIASRLLLIGMVLTVLCSGCQSESVRPASNRSLTFIPMEQIYGIGITGRAAAPEPSRAPAGPVQFIAAVTGRGDDIYLADRGRGRIVHISRATRQAVLFSSFDIMSAGDLYLASDMSLYAVDQNRRRVVKFTPDGRIDESFNPAGIVTAPVAVAEINGPFRIAIADQAQHRIVVVDALGNRLDTAGNMNASPIASADIVDLAGADGELYVLDRSQPAVMIIGTDGRLRRILQVASVRMPQALTVDVCGHVLVADRFDNSVHVFDELEELHTLTTGSPGMQNLQQISDIWMDGNTLYITDGPAATIRLFHMELACSH